MKAHVPDRVFWQDWPFWLALSFGPVCWLTLIILGTPLSNGEPPWMPLLWIALIYPVVEEYVFRGGLQTALLKRDVLFRSFAGISLANVITSTVFAALHLISQPPVWAALVFFPSLVFGWMRDRYGNIQASIVLHTAYNAGFVWLFTG